jgi:hypothetical protein
MRCHRRCLTLGAATPVGEYAKRVNLDSRYLDAGRQQLSLGKVTDSHSVRAICDHNLAVFIVTKIAMDSISDNDRIELLPGVFGHP